MRFILDTNVFFALLNKEETVIGNFARRTAAQDEFIGCPMVWYEVQRTLMLRDANQYLRRVDELYGLLVWQDLTRQDWLLAAKLWARRRKLHVPVNEIEMILSAYTLNRDATIVTNRERAFTAFGVRTENWMTR